MKTLLTKLFRRRAEPAPAPEAAPVPTPAPAPRKPGDKRRKYSKGKRHPAPRGAYKADWNEPILRGKR
ncbi:MULTISPECIES: hypothetical protein [Burkholderia]|uniref:hypothetical protein n=1 Tax=Burkholderia TaxID=32008 RepID=UPI000841458A|nr:MULTISPECIES: hypothetical protein [unclassified Burkholderia]AOK29863.1 hypothetical protein AQ611_10945 [Burkholderia sp. Bp7605]